MRYTPGTRQIVDDKGRVLAVLTDAANDTHGQVLAEAYNQYAKTVPVGIHTGYCENETAKTHQMTILDERTSKGQVFVEVSGKDQMIGHDLAVTIEINPNPLGGNNEVPSAHIHFDESNLALSIYKFSNQLALSFETDVTVIKTIESIKGEMYLIGKNGG